MPSEGKPLKIDTAVIATPNDVPTQDVELMAHRRDRHRVQLESGDAGSAEAVAALALGAAARRAMHRQDQHLVRCARRLGASWSEIARALDDEDKVRSAFEQSADTLSEPEQDAGLQQAHGEGR